jgi:hypothetical protein
VDVRSEPVALSYSSRHFDGVHVGTVVLTAKSVQFVTDTLGAWTPVGDGTAAGGLVLRHRRNQEVYITLSPFAGPGPGKDDDEWRSYRWAVSAGLGAETTITNLGCAGTAGGIPSFGSWTTREALFETPLPTGVVGRAQRHVVATDGERGVVVILAGPAQDVAAVEQDFRFLLARLEQL